MSEIEQQNRDDEDDIILPFLPQIGISTSQIIEHNNAPDYKIRLLDNSVIGLEVTNYSPTDNKETKKALQNFFSEYLDHLRDVTMIPYSIDVSFLSIDYPTFNLRRYKKEIFKELDSFIPEHEPLFETKFIDEAIFEPSYDDFSHIDFCPMIEYEDVDTVDLENRLRNKENLLIDYKANTENNNVEEYWLVVNFGMEEKGDMRDYQLPVNFQSKYQRIYFVDKNCKPSYKLVWSLQQPRP